MALNFFGVNLVEKMDKAEEVSITETSPGVWRVTFDGCVLGDSRGYDHATARREAIRMVEQEQAWALRDGRFATLVWRPA